VTVVWTVRALRVSVVSEDCAEERGAGEAVQMHNGATDAEVAVVRTTRGGSVWVEAGWSRTTPCGVDPT
jgi:hypothetical protein